MLDDRTLTANDDPRPAEAPEDGPLGQRLLARFYRATHALNADLSAALTTEYGLELRDFMVLSSISKGHRYPSDIARRLHASKFAVSRVLQRLIDRGLIAREIDGQDSRRVRLEATPAGAKIRSEALDSMRVRMTPLLDELGEQRAEALVAGLEQVIEHFAKSRRKAGISSGGAA